MTTINVSEARKNLLELVNRVDSEGLELAISKHGKTKAVLISPQLLESYNETIEFLSDPHLMKAIRAGRRDIKRGDFINLKDLKTKP